MKQCKQRVKWQKLEGGPHLGRGAARGHTELDHRAPVRRGAAAAAAVEDRRHQQPRGAALQVLAAAVY